MSVKEGVVYACLALNDDIETYIFNMELLAVSQADNELS